MGDIADETAVSVPSLGCRRVEGLGHLAFLPTFSLWKNVHHVKCAILTVLRCATQEHRSHSQCVPPSPVPVSRMFSSPQTAAGLPQRSDLLRLSPAPGNPAAAFCLCSLLFWPCPKNASTLRGPFRLLKRPPLYDVPVKFLPEGGTLWGQRCTA